MIFIAGEYRWRPAAIETKKTHSCGEWESCGPRLNYLILVIPAKAGIQGERQGPAHVALDSRFRGNDDKSDLEP
jgi:hypothetical protein